jgi:2-polyprenyl-3-methyl-5-hydroxy-6-metoxy-1,4-benzoquinol methylase
MEHQKGLEARMATATVKQEDFDSAKGEAFAERMLAAANEAALLLMTSIGHRTRLWDAFAAVTPVTCARLASAAGLSERYVREWLGAMVAAQVADYDAERQTYSLPAEHAAYLVRGSEPNNMAAFSQWVGVMGAVEDQVVEAFYHGRGVPYSEYLRFHEVMAEESAQSVVAGLEEHILPLVPGIMERLERGIEVLDLGCGAGRAINYLARRYPRSRFTGYDFSAEAIEMASTEASAAGLKNVGFEVRDAAAIDDHERFDFITTFDAIHDQAQPAMVLRNIERALKSDGVYLMQDIGCSSFVQKNAGHRLGTFVYTISCMHCMSVSLACGGAGLGAAWGKELALKMLGEAGFGYVRVETLPHDFMNFYYVARKATS